MLNDRKALTELQVPGNVPPVTLYFGSQTGTAEKFCATLNEEADMLDMKSTVIDFNDFTEEEFLKH